MYVSAKFFVVRQSSRHVARHAVYVGDARASSGGDVSNVQKGKLSD